MIRRQENTPLPAAPSERQPLPLYWVEGEHFTARCPEWCEPVADGAWPEALGWYLAVKLLASNDPPEVEPVWLERQGWAYGQEDNGWLVNVAGSDALYGRRDFYWIGKIRLPSIAMESAS